MQECCFLQPGFKAWLRLWPSIPWAQCSDEASALGPQEPPHSIAQQTWWCPEQGPDCLVSSQGVLTFPHQRHSSDLADAKQKYIIKSKCCGGASPCTVNCCTGYALGTRARTCKRCSLQVAGASASHLLQTSATLLQMTRIFCLCST